jgi:uncharacterized protein (TIGR03089 family)
VELSGATTANWVAKTANLLVDGYARPDRVGLLLPLHWQLVCFLLGAAAAGSEVVVASQAADLAGCPVAFVRVEDAEAALDAGVDDVLAVSGHPLGARLAAVPALVLDAAAEVPGYGDRFPGPHPAGATVLLGGEPFATPDLGLGPHDRVLTTLAPATAKGLGVLLAALRAGASLVLAPGEADLAGIAAAEQVTAVAGTDLPGTRAL